jgi:hypothetical protein
MQILQEAATQFYGATRTDMSASVDEHMLSGGDGFIRRC